ncbi:hypothetical protein [Lacisediminimonas sp.]|uniref:hypothetical protein n=1 Tax=Lacisediminimonas sp. TaxID=3060582 RepID=UPI0027231F5C|nr:hypothetical protein [Lacisediminimonas sp.]MDO8298457.1 hypothetical protein [Lacisediminimonas sp.]
MPAPVTETRVSWFRIFNDLKVRGWSVYRIEEHLDVAKSTMLGWKAGAEPRHADGELLIVLWIQVTGEARDALPLERRYPSGHSRW